MRGKLVPLVLAVVAALLSSGCVVHPGRYLNEPFSVEVPKWYAGNSWTYAITGQHWTNTTQDAGTHASQSWTDPLVEQRVVVFNTTRELDGGPVYFVRAESVGQDAKPQSKVWGGKVPISIHRQSDLARIGRGEFGGSSPLVYAYAGTVPPPTPYSSGGSYVYLGTQYEELPGFKFPLANHKEWTITRSSIPELRFVAQVRGEEWVTLDDGAHLAVHVFVHGFIPGSGPANAADDGADAPTMASFYGDYWWGVAEGNLIQSHERTELAYNSENSKGVTRHEAQTVKHVRLTDVRLDRTFEEAVPTFRAGGQDDAELTQVRLLRIEHNAGPEPDVGTGPIRIRFDLADPTSFSPVPYNETRFMASWQLVRIGDEWSLPAVNGPSLEADIAEPGLYQTTVDVFDQDFGAVVVHLEQRIGISRSQTGFVAMDPGPSGPSYTVVEFRVPTWGAIVDLDFALRPAVPDLGTFDEGAFILRYPSGFAEEYTGTPHSISPSPGEVGSYALEWHPSGPVIIGDDPGASVRVWYPTDWWHGPYYV